MELDRTERRIIAALLEKRWTTPEQYPLTLNALVSACNQKSNRDPVMSLTDFEIEGCIRGLRISGLIVVHERDGGRVQRYAEKFERESNLSRQEMAILAELMLRGSQTEGELYRRCKRMAHYANEGEIGGLLRELARGHWVRILPKRPRERHQRWEQVLGPEGEAPTTRIEEAPARVDGDTVAVTQTSGAVTATDPIGVEPPTAAAPEALQTPAGPAVSDLQALSRRLAALELRMAELERQARED